MGCVKIDINLLWSYWAELLLTPPPQKKKKNPLALNFFVNNFYFVPMKNEIIGEEHT